MTRGETAKLVAIVLATWPAQAGRVTNVDAMIDAWHMALEDVPSKVASSALRRLQATAKFLPSPAEIRLAADEVSRGEALTPAEAWGDVVRAIGRWGMNRPPGEESGWNFNDLLTRRVVDSLGWEELCQSTNQVADRARFIEEYQRVLEKDRVDAVTSTLPGASVPKRLRGTATMAELMAAVTPRLLEEGKKRK